MGYYGVDADFWDPPSINNTKSSFVTLPPFPVPFTLLISIPFCFAICLTAGVAKALLPGEAVSNDLETEEDD